MKLRKEIKIMKNYEINTNECALTEDQLDSVSGGIALATCYTVLNCCMVAMAGKPLWLLLSR